MPFIQPTGASVGSRNVASIVNSLTNSQNTAPEKKPEPEKCCIVRNNWVKSHDESMSIFTKTWVPIGTTPAQTVVVFVHDIAEHCERYQSLFTYFTSKGIEVQAFDLPGFGETGARADSLGVTGGYNSLIKEMDNAIDRACSSHPSKPVFLMGHGMGGALVLNYVCGLGQRTTSLAGIISSSPYIKPTMAGAGSRFPGTYNRLAKWYPHIGVQFPVAPQELTRDRAEQERYLADGLICGSVSLQCLGDMIYQGQKVLARRWKYFPGPLPTLLLHGTDDPICSYQATSLLSAQLLKRNPSSFIFKSWKGNRHDPHWDIDALSVRSEFTHWIRGHCKHFVSPPLEPGMVRYDSLKSFRSKSAHTQSKGKDEGKGKDESKGKDEGKDKNSAAKSTPSPPTNVQSGDKCSSSSDPTNTKPAAEAEPEAIQDLEGLRRQQVLRLQKAEEKRREYSQGAPSESSAPGTSSPSTANIQPPLPPLPQPVENELDASKDSLESKTIPNQSSGVSLEELTLKLEMEANSAPIPRAISLDQMTQSVDMPLSTMSPPLVQGVIAPDALTASTTSKVEENEINASGGTTHAPTLTPTLTPILDAQAVDKSTAPIEPPAKEEINGDAVVQPSSAIILDPAVQDEAPVQEQGSAIVVVEATGKDMSAAPIETTVSNARTSLEEEEEEEEEEDENEEEVLVTDVTHMGHPPPEQSMIAV
ncbi:hypothetical protein CPB97_007740 [Podila verticillata]|nr:hypothetical protein CPB97_007740 [Podila verticillata]